MRRLLRALTPGIVAALAACGSTVSAADRAAPRPSSDALAAPGASTGTDDAPIGGLLPDAATPSDPGADDAATSATRPPGSVGTDDDAAVPATADRSPISVGILYTNNDAAASAGVDNGNTFSPRAAFEAFVAAHNDRGGLAGRPIEPVYVELRSSSVSLAADLEAACATFTEDDEVEVVLSTIGVFNEEFATCLADAGTPQIAGDYALGDDIALDAATSFFAPDTLTVDDRLLAVLDTATGAGRLGADDRIGVVVEGCPYNRRAFERTVEPAAARLGLTIAAHVEARCFQGINDLSGQASEMGSAVLQFRSAGVTTVLFVSGSFEGNLMLLFATAAESQGYRPRYALSSAVVPAVQETNTPSAQLANAFGVGWLPTLDLGHESPPGAAATRCLGDLDAGAGVAPASPADRYTAFSVCDTFALADAALRATGGATGPTTFTEAVDALGTTFAAAAAHGEQTDFGGGRRTGPRQARLFAWTTACGCFDYVGEPFALPR